VIQLKDWLSIPALVGFEDDPFIEVPVEVFRMTSYMRFSLLYFVVFSLTFLLVSCNYGGPGFGGSPYCLASCQEDERCCGSYPNCDPWDETRMQECICTCTNIERTATVEFLQGKKECDDLPCGNEQLRQTCRDNLLASCSSGLTPAVESFCTRVDDCSVNDEFDECAQTFNEMMGCYSQKTHDAMLTCSSVGTCETFMDEFEPCFDAKLGIVDCFPSD